MFQARAFRTHAEEEASPAVSAVTGGMGLPGHRLIVRALPPGAAARRARAVLREVLDGAVVGEAAISDAELAVGELAANAETHAASPYEIRIITIGGQPVWCEVVDGDQNLDGIPATFEKLRQAAEPATELDPEGELPQVSGHGLLIVHRLSGGRCLAFPTVSCIAGEPGKAVAFALPMGGGLT